MHFVFLRTCVGGRVGEGGVTKEEKVARGGIRKGLRDSLTIRITKKKEKKRRKAGTAKGMHAVPHDVSSNNGDVWKYRVLPLASCTARFCRQSFRNFSGG